jgi:hypothetical protein
MTGTKQGNIPGFIFELETKSNDKESNPQSYAMVEDDNTIKPAKIVSYFHDRTKKKQSHDVDMVDGNNIIKPTKVGTSNKNAVKIGNRNVKSNKNNENIKKLVNERDGIVGKIDEE